MRYVASFRARSETQRKPRHCRGFSFATGGRLRAVGVVGPARFATPLFSFHAIKSRKLNIRHLQTRYQKEGVEPPAQITSARRDVQQVGVDLQRLERANRDAVEIPMEGRPGAPRWGRSGLPLPRSAATPAQGLAGGHGRRWCASCRAIAARSRCVSRADPKAGLEPGRSGRAVGCPVPVGSSRARDWGSAV